MNQDQTIQVNQNQNQNQTNASQFDPSTLSPEAMSWVDRQRTQASQTARNNARKELMKDETFLNEIRGNIQPQVEQTMEEKFQSQLDALTRRACVSEVQRVLSGMNLPQEETQSYVDMFAGSDIDASVERATQFVSLWNKNLQNINDVKQAQAVQNMPTPQTSTVTVSEEAELQKQLDEARKETNFKQKDIRIAAIYRSAAEKGIQLI